MVSDESIAPPPGHGLPDGMLAERLLQVIDEGRRTATYKLALVLALMDACAEGTDDRGMAPAVLHTRTVAEHVLRLYLPQARRYFFGGGDLELRQITMKQSTVMAAILRLQILQQQHRLHNAHEVARALPDEYKRCLDEVEATFARYPLRLLQVVGKENRPFLYDVDWGESVTLKALHREGGGLIRFRPDAGDQLLRLAPLVRPLVELHWARMVASINRILTEEERLRGHLFGTKRVSFPKALRGGLLELQHHACFYCGSRITVGSQVDHFTPWSRWPNDAIENLVLADRCNNYKSDYLAALPHVDHWATRLTLHGHDIASIAASCDWESEPVRSLSYTRSSYAHLPLGTPLWLSGDQFTEDPPQTVTDHLAALKR